MMVFISSLLSLCFALSAISLPVPPSTAISEAGIGSGVIPAAINETGPITFGDLTLPSLGGTFNDFFSLSFPPDDSSKDESSGSGSNTVGEAVRQNVASKTEADVRPTESASSTPEVKIAS
ncbi:hypothetical protein K439DRAFT_1632513 [Ramaria rubella]|nr:hypothetical protein K439DRAFT_1632513 [Ramaria rubella]